MLEFQLDEAVGVVHMKPHGKLHREDFIALTDVVDQYIEKTGVLPGLLIDTSSFPFWDSFETFRAHMVFIEDHHMKVARVAVVTDDPLLSVFPKIADFFLQSEVKLYHDSERDQAWQWLLL
jgi:hypothetical protein